MVPAVKPENLHPDSAVVGMQYGESKSMTGCAPLCYLLVARHDCVHVQWYIGSCFSAACQVLCCGHAQVELPQLNWQCWFAVSAGAVLQG